MERYYKIANLLVKMDSFGRTVTQAEPYMTQPGDPDITIYSNWERIKAEVPSLSDEDCEYISTGSSFYRQLLGFDGMLLHASAVVVDNRAYLFTANSGAGKSTHTALWLQQFGDRAWLLNDDKPALRLENSNWYAYGTPWSGKHDLSRNARVPLGGICHLRQGEENHIAPLSGSAAILALFEQTARPPAAELRSKLLELLDSLITCVPLWQLSCNMSPEAAIVSYETMSGKTNKEI